MVYADANENIISTECTMCDGCGVFFDEEDKTYPISINKCLCENCYYDWREHQQYKHAERIPF